MLSDISICSTWIKAAILKMLRGGNLSILYTKSRFVRMLETAYFYGICKEFTFMSAIIERFCESIVTSPVTNMFTKYVKLLNFIRSLDLTPGWAQVELQKQRTDISHS